MTTLLEYVLTKYLGKPARSTANGVSYWLCPICDHDTFHSLPDKPQFKHRAKCWNPDCGFRGDVADMLREFHPDEAYGDRLIRIERLFYEWQGKNQSSKSRRKVTKG